MWLDFRVGLTRIGVQHQMDGFWTKFLYNEIDLICIGSHVAQLLVHRACIGHGICMAAVMRSSWLRPPPESPSNPSTHVLRAVFIQASAESAGDKAFDLTDIHFVSTFVVLKDFSFTCQEGGIDITDLLNAAYGYMSGYGHGQSALLSAMG